MTVPTLPTARDCDNGSYHRPMEGTRYAKDGTLSDTAYSRVDDTAVCLTCRLPMVYANTYGASVSSDSVNYDAPISLVPLSVNALTGFARACGVDATFVVTGIGPRTDGYDYGNNVELTGHWDKSNVPMVIRVATVTRPHWIATGTVPVSDEELPETANATAEGN